MTPTLEGLVREHVEKLNSIPTVPAVIRPLLHYMDTPVDQIEIQRIVDLVSCDELIAAQCLRVANSALYFRSREVRTVRGAVVVLGIRHIREILLSCSLLQLIPTQNWVIDPLTFWEHSFGCALVSRYFARKVRYREPERAHLAGLLHDLGVLVNLVEFQEGFRAAAQLAMAEQIPLHQAESSAMGFTHCDTGKVVAEQWKLPEDIGEVIAYHHDVPQAKLHPVLVALVALSDWFCRTHGLAYGIPERINPNIAEDPAWLVLTKDYPYLAQTDPVRLTSDLERFVAEARTLVRSIFRH